MTFKQMIAAEIVTIVRIGHNLYFRLGDRLFESEEDVERQMYPEEFEQ